MGHKRNKRICSNVVRRCEGIDVMRMREEDRVEEEDCIVKEQVEEECSGMKQTSERATVIALNKHHKIKSRICYKLISKKNIRRHTKTHMQKEKQSALFVQCCDQRNVYGR